MISPLPQGYTSINYIIHHTLYKLISLMFVGTPSNSDTINDYLHFFIYRFYLMSFIYEHYKWGILKRFIIIYLFLLSGWRRFRHLIFAIEHVEKTACDAHCICVYYMYIICTCNLYTYIYMYYLYIHRMVIA